MKKIITIDGPAGSGKEKISKYISKKYKLYHIDSGMFYRKLAYKLKINKIKTSDKNGINQMLKKTKILSLRKLNELRDENIGKAASEIAKYEFVRNFVNSQQRLVTKNYKKKKDL